MASFEGDVTAVRAALSEGANVKWNNDPVSCRAAPARACGAAVDARTVALGVGGALARAAGWRTAGGGRC